jgi:hypothetical protein
MASACLSAGKDWVWGSREWSLAVRGGVGMFQREEECGEENHRSMYQEGEEVPKEKEARDIHQGHMVIRGYTSNYTPLMAM